MSPTNSYLTAPINLFSPFIAIKILELPSVVEIWIKIAGYHQSIVESTSGECGLRLLAFILVRELDKYLKNFKK